MLIKLIESTRFRLVHGIPPLFCWRPQLGNNGSYTLICGFFRRDVGFVQQGVAGGA
jgi:hypothetical protein